MNRILPVLLALAVAAGPAWAGTPSPKADTDKVTCRKEAEIGSRFAKKRCHTAAQWAELRRRSRELVEQLQPANIPAKACKAVRPVREKRNRVNRLREKSIVRRRVFDDHGPVDADHLWLALAAAWLGVQQPGPDQAGGAPPGPGVKEMRA